MTTAAAATDFNQQQEDKGDDDELEADDDASEPSINDSVYTSQDSGIKSVAIFTLLSLYSSRVQFSLLFNRSFFPKFLRVSLLTESKLFSENCCGGIFTRCSYCQS